MLGICTAQAQLIKDKAPVDPKYLAGAVPTVDGKVVFSKEIPYESTLGPDSLYKLIARFVARSLNREEVLKRTGMVNDVTTHYMEVGVVEYLTFKKSALVLDRTQIIYKITLYIANDKVSVQVSDISYYYDEERDPTKLTAEEWITDEAALNKKKTDFTVKHGKFRTATIDLFDKFFNDIEQFVTEQ